MGFVQPVNIGIDGLGPEADTAEQLNPIAAAEQPQLLPLAVWMIIFIVVGYITIRLVMED